MSAFAHGSQANVEWLANRWGTVLLPGRGHLVINAKDCLGFKAPDVRVDLDPSEGATVFYASPSPLVADHSLDRTTKVGLAGVFNLTPGIYTVTARHAADGGTIGETTFEILEGTVTDINVWPARSD